MCTTGAAVVVSVSYVASAEEEEVLVLVEAVFEDGTLSDSFISVDWTSDVDDCVYASRSSPGALAAFLKNVLTVSMMMTMMYQAIAIL